MSFQMNPNFGNELNAMYGRLDAAFESVRVECQGKPVSEVKEVLKVRFAAANEGARITEPELTQCATLLAGGKRVWVDRANGHIMADD